MEYTFMLDSLTILPGNNVRMYIPDEINIKAVNHVLRIGTYYLIPIICNCWK